MKPDKAKLEKYADLKNSIKRLEEEAALLQPEIMAEMGDAQEISTEFGTFTVASRRKWTYPESVEKSREELKKAELEAQQTGYATYDEKPYLVFKAV